MELHTNTKPRFLPKKAIIKLILTVMIMIVTNVNSQNMIVQNLVDEMITVHGQSISVYHGGTGSPTILFEPGLNESYYTFRSIQDTLSLANRTFSYNRSGFQDIVDSDERTSLKQVQYLHELLNLAGEQGPYIIVAHSLGGYNARLFCSEYQDEISGIVFIDCSSESQPWSSSIKSGELTASQLRKSAQLVMETNKRDVLRNIPIIVLVADYANQYFPELMYWQEYQRNLTSRSKYSKLITVKNSSHQIQSEHPDVVISAIQELLNK